MSKIKPKRAFAAEHFDTFDGFGGSRRQSKHSASSISNFRLTADGSLKKRGGYEEYLAFPSAIRAFWEGTIGSIRYRFVICGTDIFDLDESSGEMRKLDSVPTLEGEVRFFELEGELYLLDGEQIRVFYPATQNFIQLAPYMPLYGKNWDPIKRGSVNEPLNLLSNKIRVHYENPSNATSFTLPFAYKSIVGVLVNGVKITNYSATAYSNVVTIPASSTGYYVEIAMEASLSDQSEDPLSARRCEILTAQQQNTLLLYGTNAGYRIYPSSPVSQYELDSCRVFDTKTKPLYFLESHIVTLGDRDHPLYSLCRYGSNVLAYSGLGTWMLNPSEEVYGDFTPSPILANLTSTAPESSILVGETPVLVNTSGIFLLDIPASEKDLPRLEKISDPIEELLSGGFGKYACAWENKTYNEIWFCDTSEPDAPILVYQYLRKQWYLFEGISASKFIDTPSGTLFVSEEKLHRLDDTLCTDNGEEIVAYYQSGYFSFSHPEAQKRALRMVTCARIKGDGCYILVESENGQQTFLLEGSDRDAPDYFDHRVLLGRFRFLRFRLLMGGTEQNRIQSISFYANL